MLSRSAQQGVEQWEGSLGILWVSNKEQVQAPFWGSKDNLWLPQMVSARGSKATTAQRGKTVAGQSI